MVYNKEKWIAALKKAIVDTKHESKPTSGKPAAIAALRYLRDALLENVKESDDSDEGTFFKATVKDAFNELIKSVNSEGPDSGFLCNASAAAKAAGFKTSESI